MTEQNMKEITEKYGKEYILRQLAEECAELNQAALKVIRSWRMETPVTPEKAFREMLKEIADVEIMLEFVYSELMSSAGHSFRYDYKDMKKARMVRRMIKGDWSKHADELFAKSETMSALWKETGAV